LLLKYIFLLWDKLAFCGFGRAFFFYSVQLQAGPSHHGMALPQVVEGGTAYNVEDSCEYIEKQSWTESKGWSSAWGLGEVVTSHRKT